MSDLDTNALIETLADVGKIGHDAVAGLKDAIRDLGDDEQILVRDGMDIVALVYCQLEEEDHEGDDDDYVGREDLSGDE